MNRRASALAVMAAAVMLSCAAEPPSPAGSWRAVLDSPGGPLPFGLEIEGEGRELSAVAVNGPERAPFSAVEVEGDRLRLELAWYDARIEATFEGDRLTGEWSKTAAEGISRLPFSAERGAAPRFTPRGALDLAAGDAEAVPSVDGVWEAVFTDKDGEKPARGEFTQRGLEVEGTFLTPTGDYRFLDGSYEDGLLRLSTFDGAHAFLFQARAQADGSLAGDFWSRDTYHATWTARPASPEEVALPDAWEAVGLSNEEGRLDFRFPDLDGRPVSLDDPRFEGKVVLVNLFGSWCPNCNDEAPLLAEWHRRFGAQGLEVVGLAYEYTGDPERDRRQLRRFAERHGIDYPLLLAGVSDKKKAAATLPDLTAVLAYPTTVFIGRDGRVRDIHSGFAGPGTGDHYQRLVERFETRIAELLNEESHSG